MFERDQEIFNLLFEAVSEGVIVLDTNQKIVATNSSTDHMFGYDKNELIEASLNILIPSDYHKVHKKHFNDFMIQKNKRRMSGGIDVYGIKKNAEVFPIELGLNPFQVNNKDYVMAILVDITERKIYTETLENTVKERTTQLRKALKKERELNELKTKFLSLVSHEFKTPLSGIQSSAILLEKYHLPEHQVKREKHIRTILNEVQFLNNILDDFLSIEKLETGKAKYSFNSFPLSKILNDVIYEANMVLKEGQRIKYPENIEGITMYQDEKILKLSLSNIIHNAIKYSPENSNIEIEIQEDDEFTSLHIRDFGIGIPKKEQDNIFSRYFRASNATLIQGTGIGLNIAKGHIENLGGTINFKSVENEGSLFSIKLKHNKEL